MADIVGSAEVQVGVDTAAAEAGLRRLQADFDRSMAAIDRSKAEARITADTTEVMAAIRDTKRRLEELDKEKADPNVTLDTKKFNAEYAALKAELDALDKRKVDLQIDTRRLKDANREMSLAAKSQQEMAKQSDKLAAATKRNADAEQRAFMDRARLQQRAIEDDHKLSEGRLKEAVQIQKLRQEYSRLAGEQRRLGKTGRPGGIFRTGNEIRDLERVGAEMELTKHRLEALGHGVDDLDPTLEDHQNLLGRWFQSLSKVRVQMGPISGTLRQMGVGFAALAPVIIGLAGSVSSLIGVLGTGLAGAGAVGIGAMGGFALSAAGIGMALRPVIKDLSAAEKATKAYNDAVLKYGKSSSQAQDKLDQLRTTMQGISPVARKAVRDFVGLQSDWQKMTTGVRKPLFETFAEGIRTAKALLPTFAHQTVATFTTLSQGTNKWLQQLRSPEAKDAISQLMGNFRRGLPDLMAGLGNIAAMFGRIGVSASKLWPSLMHGFKQWTQNLSDAVGSGTELDAKIARLVDHMRSLGHFAQATGRLLISFFNTGADSGKNLLDSFTATENKWSDWMQSVEGQHSLRDWFSESETTTKEFFSVLGGISKLMFEVGRATAPLVQGLLRVVTVVGDIVDAMTSLAPTRALLTGLGTALGTAFAVYKVVAFTRAIKDAAVALRGLSIVQSGLDLIGLGGVGRGTKTATTTVEEMERSLAGLPPAAAAAGTGLTLMGTVGVAAVGGLTYAIVDSINSAKAFDRELDQVQKTLGGFVNHDNTFGLKDLENLSRVTQEQRQYAKQLVPANQSWQQSILDVQYAQRGLADAIKRSGKNSLESRQAMLNLRSAQSELGKQTLAFKIATSSAFDSASDRVNKAKKSLDTYNQGLSQIRRETHLAANRDQGFDAIGPTHNYRQMLASNQTYLDLLKSQQSAEQRLSAAQDQKAGEMMNFQRILRNQAPLTDRATMSAGRFIRAWGKVQGAQAKKLIVGADNSKAVTKLQKTSSLLNKVDGKQATVDILGNSKNAEQAGNRIERRLRSIANQRYQAELTAEDHASHVGDLMHHHLQADAGAKYQARIDAIDNASGKGKSVKQQMDDIDRSRNVAKIDADTSQARAAISAINAQLNALNGKTATTHTTNVIETKYTTSGHPAGRAAGGPAPVPTARSKELGTGGKIMHPQYIVGEESPRHAEWIITENPSRRDSNQGYLAAAADAIGMTVVPRFGGGGKHHPHKPPKKGKGPHTSAHTPKPGDAEKGVSAYDYWSAMVEYYGGLYSNERSNEEAYFPSDATGIPAYNYDLLKGYLNSELDAYDHQSGALRDQIKGGLKQRKNTIKHANSLNDKKIAAFTKKGGPLDTAENQLGHAKHKLAGIDKKKHPDAYSKAKTDVDNAQAKVDNLQQRLKDMKDAQKAAVKNADSTVAGLNQSIGDWQRELNETIPISRQAVVNERDQLVAMSKGKIGFIDPSTAGGGTASTAAQQFSASGAMLALYRGFGSNVFGAGAPILRGTSGGVSGPGGSAGSVASSAALGDSAAPASRGISGTSGAGVDQGATAQGTTINQVMNFAAPPPDPHTWSKNALFELGAAA